MFPKLGVPLKFLILIVILGLTFVFTFLSLNQTANETRRDWNHYQGQVAMRQKQLMDVKSQFGYGGGIHSFKNYVLRKQPRYYEKSLENFEKAQKIISSYLSLADIAENEKQALRTVQSVFDKYKAALLKAKQMFGEGKMSNEVDAVIKIDDAPAFQAFKSLEDNYNRMTRLATQNIETSINNGINNLGRSLFFAFILVVGFSITVVRSMTQPLEEALRNLQTSQDELVKSQEKAESANLAKSTFLANMSHEIRTPMNAILGYSQILSRDSTLSPDQMESIESINKSGNHLLTLINDILDISKIESGGMEVNPVNFNLLNLIELVASMFQVRCHEKGLAWRVGLFEGAGQAVYGDEQKIKQVLINLLGNAVKFTQKGEVKLEVKNLGNHKYQFEVEDTGPGIEPSFLNNIFEPFKQDRAGHHEGGTGLGLAISHRHVGLMGGDLWVESKPGQGSKFIFALLLPPAEGEVIPASEDTSLNVLRLAPGVRVKALVVDDVYFNRDALSQILTSIQVEVDMAENGKIGVGKALKNKYDIIFMDMRMPEMGGKEAIVRIQEKLGKENPKIVAITASVFSHQEAQFLKIGCHDFISKPFQVHQIFDTLQKLLRVEYEYDHESASEEDHKRSIPDFSVLSMPEGMFLRLKKAAEFYSITEIEEIFRELEAEDDSWQALVSYLRVKFLKKYDLEGFVKALEKINIE